MTATQTVDQCPQLGNFSPAPAPITPRHGVVTLYGYGINVRVDRGHLLIQDGIGPERWEARLPRVGHRLRRLVVIGSDGMVSLSAWRWLADQDAAFVMLERDGSVLTTTGPVRPSDARLRRAQALAGRSDVALRIARELVGQKLAGQEQVARSKLLDSATTETIARFRAAVETAETIPALRLLESQGAAAYWAAWQDLPVVFPKSDLPRVPEHWRRFGSRTSALSGSPGLAVNPANAILNYLYAVLESESRLAAATLGLDPGLGFIHVDTPARDSLACDLMEPVRPQVDAYVLDWITRQPLRREWFFEQSNGNCRLIGSFAAKLSETAPTWGRAVAPFAEWVAHTLWASVSKPPRQAGPATRLTQSRKREARGSSAIPALKPAPHPERICPYCGKPLLRRRSTRCASCAVGLTTKRLVEAARSGRVAAHTPTAEARRAEAQRRHESAKRAWLPSSLPPWLDKQAYVDRIQPRLALLANSAIASALGVSLYYAVDIRRARVIPHPRHWQTLAWVVGVSPYVEPEAP
jgi:CRISPR-associated endonuclease Cas1